MEHLSSPMFMQNCNWTKKQCVNDYYYTLIQLNLRKYLTIRIIWFEIELCFEHLFILISRIVKQKLSDDGLFSLCRFYKFKFKMTFTQSNLANWCNLDYICYSKCDIVVHNGISFTMYYLCICIYLFIFFVLIIYF